MNKTPNFVIFASFVVNIVFLIWLRPLRPFGLAQDMLCTRYSERQTRKTFISTRAEK